MAKQTYGQKHQNKQQDDKADLPVYEYLLPPKRTRSPYEAKLMDILLSPEKFKQDFLNLSLDEQLAMIKLLQQTAEYGQCNELKGLAKNFNDAAVYHLNKIHQIAGTSYDEGIYYKVAKDEKRLIRMDCYGCIDKRQPYQLGSFYKYFLKPENRGKWPLNAYKMDESPMWRVFMQFSSFRKITPVIRRHLQKRGINPDALKVMRVNDFCDVIFNAFKKSTQDVKVSFVAEGESIKAKFVKEVMKACGVRYQKMLMQEGYRPEAVYSVCNAMQRYGITDTSSVTVTSLVYTPRIINDLQAAGYNLKSMKVGSRIHPEFVEYLVDHHQEKLIQARDENGEALTAKDLPRLDFHHVEAVMFAGNQKGIACTNYRGMLVDPRIHAGYIHLFDKIIKQSDEVEQYYSRLNIENKRTCLMIGFGPDKRLYADMENNLEFVRHANEDKKYIVNYFNMMQKLLQNEAEIATGYGIDYSRVAVTQVLDDIKNLKEHPDADAQKIKDFETWFKKTQIRSRKEKKKIKKQENKETMQTPILSINKMQAEKE